MNNFHPSAPQGAPNPRAPGTHNIPEPEISGFSNWLASLAGYDLRLVSLYAGADARHERMKLVCIGSCVLIPAVMALFTAFFFLEAYVRDTWLRGVAAVIVSLFVLFVDRALVATLSKQSFSGVLIRVLMSACMALSISEPLVNKIFAPTITGQLLVKLDRELGEERKRYRVLLQENREETAHLTAAMKEAQKELGELSPEKIAAQNLERETQRENEKHEALRSRRQGELGDLEANRSALLKQRNEVQNEIEAKLVLRQREIDGGRDTKKPGVGGVTKHLDDAITTLRADLQRINGNILAVDQRIAAVSTHRVEDERLGAEFSTSLSGADDGEIQLTADQQAEKDRLIAQIAGYGAMLADLHERYKQLAGEMARLPERFDISVRNDIAAQSTALWEVLQTNDYARLVVGALLLLFFLCDTAAVFVKLIVHTEYDDYIDTSRRLRKAHNADLRSPADDQIALFDLRAIDRVGDGYQHAYETLQRIKPGQQASSREKQMYEETARGIQYILESGIADAINARPDGRHASISTGFPWRTIRGVWWFFRSKLGGVAG